MNRHRSDYIYVFTFIIFSWIHFLCCQFQGKSREEAEQAFMEVAVDVEERQGLSQEIQEAVSDMR